MSGPNTTREQVTKEFNDFDKNKSGYLERGEIAQFLSKAVKDKAMLQTYTDVSNKFVICTYA